MQTKIQQATQLLHAEQAALRVAALARKEFDRFYAADLTEAEYDQARALVAAECERLHEPVRRLA